MGFFDKLRKKLTKKERIEERMQKIRESGKEGERNFERDNSLSKIERVHHGADYVKTVHDSAGRERKEYHEVKRNNSPLSKLQKKTHGLKVDRYEKTPYGDVKKTYNRTGDELKQDPMSGKWKKVRKRDSSVFGSLLGSNSSSKPKTNTGFSTGKPKRNSLKIWSDEIKPNTKRRYKSSNFLTVGNEDKPKKSSRSSSTSILGSNSSSKRKKSGGSGFENFLFGSSSSGKPKKSSRSSSVSIWGSSAPSKRKKSSRSSSVSIWGSSSSSKPKKSSRSNYDSLLGSGSSSRRKKNNGFW